MAAVKIIEVTGTSSESWEDAAAEAVRQANKTIDDIRGVEITDWTAKVDGAEISEYRATTHIAFPVHQDQ